MDFKKNPLLLDPKHPGLAHWLVCPAKMTPAQINSAIAKWEEIQSKKPSSPLTDTVIPYEPNNNNNKKVSIGMEYETVPNPISQVKFNPESFVMPETEPQDPTSKFGKTREDYILEKFDETCNALIKNQEVFAQSIANQLQIISNTLATLASNQRSIMRRVGIPDT